MNLEDQKQLPTNTVSNLLELDRHLIRKSFKNFHPFYH